MRYISKIFISCKCGEMVDLVERIRSRFKRNAEFIEKLVKGCKHFNSNKRLLGPLNLIMMSTQHKRINNTMVLDKKGKATKSEFRWILPEKDKGNFYSKHRDACQLVPKDCGLISLSFCAENAKFDGGSIRVKFYKKRYIEIFSKTITLPKNLLVQCWEFKVPKKAFYYSISFKLHPEKEDTERKIIKKNRMVLRSDTSKKTLNPISGKWTYRNISNTGN